MFFLIMKLSKIMLIIAVFKVILVRGINAYKWWLRLVGEKKEGQRQHGIDLFDNLVMS